MRTLSIGQDIERFASLDSTNSEMLRRIKEKELPEGKLIIAEEQTQGRGQRGEIWESERGMDLTFSILLYPKGVAPDEQFDLNRAITLGIAESVMYLHPPACDQLRIKWPNDILLEGKKLAGILIENSVQGERIQHSVIGIGFDLKRTERETRLGHSSLESGTGLILEPEEMLERICKGVERRYFQLNRGDLSGIRQSFNESCYLLGQWGLFRNGKEEFKGLVREVDPSGQLVLEHEDGSEARYTIKELELIGPAR